MPNDHVHRPLREGDRGADVEQLQYAINREAASWRLPFLRVAVDGELAPHTLGSATHLLYAMGVWGRPVRRSRDEGELSEYAQRLLRATRPRTAMMRVLSLARRPTVRGWRRTAHREGVDWAFGSLSAAELHSAGKEFACRYLSDDAGKNLSPAEAKALTAGGIEIVVVWETSAERARAGWGAGEEDARKARGQANGCGEPAARPIYFAVDFNAQGSEVEPYFRGAGDVLGVERVGCYGSYRVVRDLLDRRLIAFAWQTVAWSDGEWVPRAQIQQYSNDHMLAGVAVDYDRATAIDIGQWGSTL